jgi:hypothetical protein
MREPVPGNQAQELAIRFSEQDERSTNGIFFLAPDDRRVGTHPRIGRKATKASRESSPARLAPILIAHESMGHCQQPGSGHLAVRDLVEASPGNRKDLGRRVLGVGCIEAPDAISKHNGVMPFEDGIETLFGLSVDGYDDPRRHSS